MAIQLINVGSIANDGTGDDLREAMLKINATGEGIFANKVNYDLQYKSLKAGTDVSLTTTDTEITINADGGIKSLVVNADTGTISLSDNGSLSITGGTDISTEIVPSTLPGVSILNINYTGWTQLSDDPNPVLGGSLDAGNSNISNVGTLTANTVTGTFLGNLVGNVHGIDIRNMYLYFDGYYDFGDLGKTYTSIIEWIAESADVDFGTITNPDPRTIDLGIL
jgi:hypothetical protein